MQIPPPHRRIHKLQIAILAPLFALCLVACSSNQPQYVDSRDYTSFGLDSHDIGDMIEKQVDSLLSQRIIKNQNEPKILVIGEIDNETSQSIDMEVIVVNKIRKHLINSGKFVIVNAGSNANIEKSIRNSRKFRDDAEYNQYTTIEQGNLISPYYELTGKITEINKTIGDDEIVEYVFALTLTNLKSGVMDWSENKRISKKLPKSEVSQTYSSNRSYTRSYSYTPSYSQDDDSDSWESVKEFFSFGAEGRNHFVLGVDAGILNLGGAINMSPIDFTIIEKSTSYNNTANIKTTAHTMYADKSLTSIPLTARAGYLRDIDDDWAFGLNFIYSYVFTMFDEYAISSSTLSDLEDKKPTFSLQRIGGEAEIYYKIKDIPQYWGGGDIYIYLGGGAMRDLGSKVKIALEAYRSGYKDISINEQGQKRLAIEQKIDSWYPIVKLGAIWYFSDYVGLSWELNYSWALSENNSISTGFGWGVVGLRIKI